MNRDLLSIKNSQEEQNSILYVFWCVPDHTLSTAVSKSHLDLRMMIDFCEKMISHYKHAFNKTPFIEFFGKEITTNDQILKVIQFLLKKECKSGIISNGVQPVEFWKKFLESQKCLTLDFSPKECSDEHFFKVVSVAHQNVSLNVKVLVYPDHFETCSRLGKKILDTFPDLLCTFLQPYGSGSNIYTTEQISQLQALQCTVKQCHLREKFKLHRALMRNFYSNGFSEEKLILDYCLNGVNNWEGWICWSGIEELAITEKFDVFGAWCCQNWFGNIIQGNVMFPEYPVFCNSHECKNYTDITVTKQRFVE